VLGNMSYLRTQCRFMAMMPQWDFLDFLAEQGRHYPTFHLRMQTEVVGLIEEQGRILGIQGNTPAGAVEIRADLVVAADGRNSVIRECSGLTVEEIGAPTDVVWMRLSKRPGDPDEFVLADHGKLLAMMDRGGLLAMRFPDSEGNSGGDATKRHRELP
jgi:2-polyprenyl-6-methoxyphenol hydroxylase-like FAD-dependent oxidoreductase